MSLLDIFNLDGGGIGNSASSNVTNQADLRIGAGDGSINTSNKIDYGSGSNNVYQPTDFGAVDGALSLALRGIEGANDITAKTIEAQGGLLNGALKIAGEQSAQFADALEKVKTSDVRVLIVAGLAVVALGAVYLFKRGA